MCVHHVPLIAVIEIACIPIWVDRLDTEAEYPPGQIFEYVVVDTAVSKYPDGDNSGVATPTNVPTLAADE